MALGCPVVSTTIGVEGLPVVPDEHYLRADTPREFADAILTLFRSPELRQRMALAAREFVADNFSSQAIARQFEAICAKLL